MSFMRACILFVYVSVSQCMANLTQSNPAVVCYRNKVRCPDGRSWGWRSCGHLQNKPEWIEKQARHWKTLTEDTKMKVNYTPNNDNLIIQPYVMHYPVLKKLLVGICVYDNASVSFQIII